MYPDSYQDCVQKIVKPGSIKKIKYEHLQHQRPNSDDWFI